MTPLTIGEPRRIEVDPRQPLFPTGLLLTPGERYDFKATGTWQDWFITTGPAGWGGWPFRLCARLPSAAVFCLCGCVGGHDSNAFAIGESHEWTVPDPVAALPDRQLYLFANDWPGKYGNNHALPPAKGGPLTVVITRLA